MNDDELYDDEAEEILDLEDDSSSDLPEEVLEVSDEEDMVDMEDSSDDTSSTLAEQFENSHIPNKSTEHSPINNPFSKRQQNTLPKNDNQTPKSKSTTSDPNKPELNRLNSNKNDSNKLQQVLNKNRFSNAPKENASNRENIKNAQEDIQNKALQTGASAAVQSAGIPKPVADAIASHITIDKIKKQFMIKVGIACLPFILVILIPILVIAGDSSGGNSSYVSSGMAENYLYGNGNISTLYDYLISIGHCGSYENCKDSDGTKFYQQLKNKLKNSNLTKGEADALIIAFIGYGRNTDEMFKAVNEIDAIASILSSAGKFSLDKVDNYKDKFISDTGYLKTYRNNDLLKTDDSVSNRENIYNSAVETARSTKDIFDSYGLKSNNVGNSFCSAITVTGDNAGTYDLEEYVARVVSKENLWAENGNLENIKAQAVAARTYALRRTNNCTSSIENSTSAQVMAEEADALATQGTSEVANQVLVDDSGNYISTEYDAFCYTSVDENNYTLCQQGVQIPTSWVNSHISQADLNFYQTHNHGRGMSQWGSRYLSTIGYGYDQILSTFYVGSTIKTLIPYSSGLEMTSSGFAKRTSRALRDNEYFYNDGATNEGECAWYAVRRTNEILATIGNDKRVTSGGNGADFCYSADYSDFTKVKDVNQLKPGMVISWSGGSGHSYGHVAIIEDVYYDASGNVESVDVSEGSNSSGSGYNTFYNGNKLVNDYIWSLNEGSYKNQVRQYNCEMSLDGSTGTGCQTFTNVPVEQLQTRWGSYHFECGIDLLS